jgi:hypothetical protein
VLLMMGSEALLNTGPLSVSKQMKTDCERSRG